jgi:hypothetical protein
MYENVFTQDYWGFEYCQLSCNLKTPTQCFGYCTCFRPQVMDGWQLL